MRSLLNICYLVPKKYGSYERFLLALGRLCTARNIRMGLLLAGEPVEVVAEAFRAGGIEWHVIPGWRNDSGKVCRRAFVKGVLTAARQREWDVLTYHFCGQELSVVAACLAARATGIPRATHVWEQHMETRLATDYRRYVSRLRVLSHFIDGFVGVSGPVAKALESRVCRPERVACIHNGVNVPDAPRRGWLRRELGLPPSAYLIVTVGTLTPLKGQDVLLDATAPILAKSPDLHVLIVGAGAIRDALEAQARRWGIEHQVHFLGIRNDVPDVLADCDLYVSPSRADAFGLAIVEAMAVGLPVVAAAVGGVVDVVSDGKTGLLVNPGDVPNLTAALSAVIADKDLARSLGQSGRDKAIRAFGMGRCVERHLDFYDELHRQRQASLHRTSRRICAGA